MEGVSERMAAKTTTRSKSRRNGSSHRSFSSFGIHVPICFSSISSQMKGPLQELPIGHSSTPLLSFGSMHHPASAFGVPIIVCAKRRPPAATPSVRGDFTPTFGEVHSDAYVHIYLISVASGFPFPSNGKAQSDRKTTLKRFAPSPCFHSLQTGRHRQTKRTMTSHPVSTSFDSLQTGRHRQTTRLNS